VKSLFRKTSIALNTTEIRHARIDEEELRRLHGQAAPSGVVFEPRALSALRAIADARRLVLLGEAGSGKSTFAQHLCLCLANARSGAPGWAERLQAGPEKDPDRWPVPYPAPVFVRLRFFANDLDSLPDNAQPGEARHLLHFIRKHLEQDDVGLGGFMEPLRDLLAAGDVLMVFDGLDEVTHPRPDERDPTHSDLLRRVTVTEAIRDFARLYPDARVLVTCRVNVYPLEGSLRPQHNWRLDFSTATLQDFDGRQIRAFVAGWFKEMRRCRRLAEDPEPMAASLLNALNSREQLDELARKPILLTQMTLLHAQNTLPNSRVDLYLKCADLLLWTWESLKAAQTERGESAEVFIRGLDVPNLNKEYIEQALGRAVFEAHRAGRPAVAEAELEAHLVAAIRHCYPNCSEPFAKGKAAEFTANWLRGRNGLFQWTGQRAFDFPHRSFREFLAARYWVAYGDPEAEDEDWDESAPRLVKADPVKWWEVFRFAAAYSAQDKKAKQVVAALEEICPSVNVPSPEEIPLALLSGRVIADLGLTKLRGVKRGLEVYQRLKPQLIHLMRDTGEGEYPNDPPHLIPPDVLPPKTRLDAGLLLDALGWTPPDLDEFVRVATGDRRFAIGKYPVTNLQYQRFLDSEDYAAEKIWKSIIGFDAGGKPENKGDEAWAWFQVANKEGKHVPRYWDYPRFGIAHRLLRVVGVTWYEAAAYCAWLNHHPPEVPGFVFRLPTEEEWLTAAGARGKRKTQKKRHRAIYGRKPRLKSRAKRF